MSTSEAAVAAFIVFGGLIIWFWTHRAVEGRYRQRPLLTGCDREFFWQLRQALPESLVIPQVPVSALIEPAGSGPARQAALAGIEARRVGYAVFDQELQLQVVVELEHRSRRARNRAARDACFESAGIPIVRFKVKRMPAQEEIRRRVYEACAAGKRRSVFGLDQPIEFQRPETPWRNTAGIHL